MAVSCCGWWWAGRGTLASGCVVRASPLSSRNPRAPSHLLGFHIRPCTHAGRLPCLPAGSRAERRLGGAADPASIHRSQCPGRQRRSGVLRLSPRATLALHRLSLPFIYARVLVRAHVCRLPCLQGAEQSWLAAPRRLRMRAGELGRRTILAGWRAGFCTPPKWSGAPVRPAAWCAGPRPLDPVYARILYGIDCLWKATDWAACRFAKSFLGS